MNDPAQWEQLQDAWQHEAPAVDVNALQQSVRRDRRNMLVAQVKDIIVALIGTGALLAIMLPHQYPTGHPFLWAYLLIIWSQIAAKIVSRLHSWSPDGADARSLLLLTMQRARSRLRHAWLGPFWLVIVLAVATIAVTFSYRNSTPSAQHAAQGTITIGAAIGAALLVFIIVWSVWKVRRQRKKLDGAKALLAQMDQQDTDHCNQPRTDA
jgi:hypothetical protein